MSEHALAKKSSLNVLQTKTAREIWLERLSRVIWLALAALCMALCIYLFTRAKYSGADSWFPMTRALDFLHGPQSLEPVYQNLFFAGHVKFQYPPTALFAIDLLRSMGIASFNELNTINAGLLIAMGLVFSAFSVRVLGRVECVGIRIPIEPIAFLVALRFYPNNLAFQLGQMQIVLGLLFLLACFALLNDRPAWAGGLIGLAASVKPQFAPLALLALWRKNWGFFAGLFSVALVLLALSVSLYGWRTHLEYLTVLEFLSKHGEYDHLNQSINGVLVRWLYEGPPLGRDPNGMIPQSVFPPFIGPVYVSTLLSSFVMFVIPFLTRSRASDPVSKLLEFCNASVLFTMASPIAWVHHYNILLPVYVIALRAALDRWERTGRWIVLVLLAVSFVATGYPWAAPSEATSPSRNLLQSHVLIGAFLLIGIVLVELRKPVRKEQGTSRQDA